MVKIKTTPEEQIAEEAKPEVSEDRIDEFAVSQFKAMGYKAPLPDSLVSAYKRFKLLNDKLRPSRLSPDGFATVATLSDLAEGKLSLTEE